MVPEKKEEPLPGWVVTNNNGRRTRAVPRPNIDPKKGMCGWWCVRVVCGWWCVLLVVCAGNTELLLCVFFVQARRKRRKKTGRTNGGIWWRNPLFRQR